MNGPIYTRQGKLVSFCAVACALAFLGSVSLSQAQIYTLIDANSSADVLPNSSSGMNQWLVDGQNQLYQQWFWYRIGGIAAGNPDQPINNISAAVVSQPLANILKTTYTNPQLKITVNYTLNGQDPGTGGADIGENIQIKNVSASAITGLHFFQYSDFDLGGTPGGNTVVMNTDSGTGLFTGATQTKQNMNLTETTSQTSDIPYANAGEAAIYSSTLDALGTSYDLNNNAGPVTGDATWALEWNFNLAAGQQITISKDKLISGVEVPEPSALALISAGLLGFGLRRRRHAA